MTSSKTTEWFKDISAKGGLKRALSYEGVSLWWFNEFGLYYLVENYVKNQKDSIGSTFKKDRPKLILKSAKYYITLKSF